MFELEQTVEREIMTEAKMLEHRGRVRALNLPRFIIGPGKPDNWMQNRGEQPEYPIYSDLGAMRGDVPLSYPNESEVRHG